ncbi:hypothetical protein U9M48_010727 [Paspalum notatum var. saurae]|uniref:DUF7595 domain-containing protein n=1 Tax=Paspalum notatum var. saurae TaxID=547442 RepID=A0AAQ3WGM9_PASNO
MVRFLAFAERSGAVILHMPGVGLLQFNLGSKEVVVLSRGTFLEREGQDPYQACLHEIDLRALLQGMSPF